MCGQKRCWNQVVFFAQVDLDDGAGKPPTDMGKDKRGGSQRYTRIIASETI
jgi:hypothetical protein